MTYDHHTTPGEYLTRQGEVVKIHLADSLTMYRNCHGHYANGAAESWTCKGRIFTSALLSDNDIVSKA